MRTPLLALLLVCACDAPMPRPTLRVVTQSLVVDAGIARIPACSKVPPGQTEIEATVQVVDYEGLRAGRSGTHEVLEGTLVQVRAASDSSLLDVFNVQVAMNVASTRDEEGLPREVPLHAGDRISLRGIYIPASSAHAHNARGEAAVIHFTHRPCGWAELEGQKYQ